MTRTLLLMRHAKSSWDDPELDDHDRPLNKRGRRAARIMGHLIEREALAIDRILCSTSVRTRETIDRVFAELRRTPPIEYLEELYCATPETMIACLKNVDALQQSVLLIAHNPGLELFLEQLTQQPRHFPTGALASIELKCDLWDQFDERTHGRLNHFWLPRELEKL